jgi:DNA-binding GntR family transcriptional regulator
MFDTTGVKKTIAEALSRPSLGELVYERLLNGILSGELPSGSTINVRSLAKELGGQPDSHSRCVAAIGG